MIKYNSKNVEKIKSKSTRVGTLILAGSLSCSLLTGCNRTLFDTKYGLDKALIYGDDTAIVVDISQWKDYKGEQLQISTDDGMIILSSSFDTNLIYGDSDEYNINNLASNGVSFNGDVYNFNESDNVTDSFNYDLLDTNWRFNKAVLFAGNDAVVLPVKQWKDYEGEQFQIITPDNLVLNLSSYNSKLIYDAQSKKKAIDFAQMYVGSDGSVTDLAKEYTNEEFNYDWFDTQWGFNKAIIIKDKTITILPISKWCDYEGEQLQLTIENGPLMVSAAYDTILVNDIESNLKAIDIASSIGKDKVINDYSKGIEYPSQIYYNGTLIDFEYGFSNGVISSANGATSFKFNQWCDYEGEQLQINLANGDIILTSSMLLDLFNGGNSSTNASTLAHSYVDENGVLNDNSSGDYKDAGFNKTILDTAYKFNYALKVNNGCVTIIPINKWRDFYNSDGNKNQDDSPNCEQIQIEMPDGSAMVTTSYDTVLVKTNNPIKIAEMFKGENGVITDLTPILGKPNTSGFNLTLFDTRYTFNYALLTNGLTSQIMPISQWKDYSEGEQLQLLFNDGSGILTSFVNTSLISTSNEDLVNELANAISGNQEEKGISRVKKYK